MINIYKIAPHTSYGESYPVSTNGVEFVKLCLIGLKKQKLNCFDLLDYNLFKNIGGYNSKLYLEFKGAQM